MLNMLILLAMTVIHTVVLNVFFVIRLIERKWVCHPICPLFTFTIGTMLNFNDGNNGHGLKNVTCKQTLLQTCIS